MYGKTGKLSPRWKSDYEITDKGYIAIRNYNHPYANSRGYILEHRLVAEKYLLNDDNSIEINSKKYLSPDYIVHHMDFNKKNNISENLCVLLPSTHNSLHNFLKDYTKSVTGEYKSPVGIIDTETIIKETNIFLGRR